MNYGTAIDRFDLKDINSDLTANIDSIEKSVELLNTYADKANNAKTKDEWESYKELWEAEKANYDSMQEDNKTLNEYYDKALKDFNDTIYIQEVVQTNIDIPSFKDVNEWRAGGAFYNEQFAGGALYSPTRPILSGEKQGNDLAYYLNSGNIMQYLNRPYYKVQSDLFGFGAFDWYRDYKVKETQVYTFQLTINKEVVYSKDFYVTFNGDGGDGIGSISGISEVGTGYSMSLSEIKGIVDNQFSVIGMSPISIGLIAFNALTNENFSFEQTVMSGLYGTVTQTINSAISNAIGQALGLNATTPMGMIGLGLIGAVLGEVMDMALGIDNSFGYGGEARGISSLGIGAYQESLGFMGLSTLGKEISVNLGFTDVATFGLTDFAGNITGGYSVTGSVFGTQGFSVTNSFGVFGVGTSTGLSFNEAFEDAELSAMTNFSNEWGLSMSEVTDFADYAGFLGDTYGFSQAELGMANVNPTNIAGLESYYGALAEQEAMMGLTSPTSSVNGVSVSMANAMSQAGFGNVQATPNVDAYGNLSLGQTYGQISDLGSPSTSDFGDADGNGGVRWCCTVMVKRGVWTDKQRRQLGVWDKKQNIVWQRGYQIGGKIVADNAKYIPYYEKNMQGFYDTHILGKKRTIYTYMAYFWIYPIVYVTGIYSILKEKTKCSFNLYKKKVYDLKKKYLLD